MGHDTAASPDVNTQVYFIGAGPGDPDLLTLKAKDILAHADVILYDFLAHPGCLAHTRPTSRRICVGKRKGQHGKTQTQINTLIRKHALSGSVVVRLKGGDPMVFGRMAEEIDCLKKAGISYAIVPGISSIQGAACSTGIPLTHRAEARSFAVLTGTTWQGETLSAHEIPDADTLIILMPNTHLKQLLTHMATHTRHDWTTPVAIITNASMATQSITCTTLQHLHDTGLQSTPKQPVMLMIGNTVSLYNDYTWQQQLPLHGYRLFLTVETLPTTPLLGLLKRMGMEICHIPMTYTIPLPLGKRFDQAIAKTQLLIFCSPRAVSRFFEMLAEKNMDIRHMAGQIAAIGQQTAQCLRHYGLFPNIVPQNTFGATGLLAELPSGMKGTKIHVYGAKKLATNLIAELRQRGAKVQHMALYATQPRPEAPVLGGFQKKDMILFSSPSQVDSFVRHYGHPDHAEIRALGSSTQAHCLRIFNHSILKSPKATYADALQHVLDTITGAMPEGGWGASLKKNVLLGKAEQDVGI